MSQWAPSSQVHELPLWEMHSGLVPSYAQDTGNGIRRCDEQICPLSWG